MADTTAPALPTTPVVRRVVTRAAQNCYGGARFPPVRVLVNAAVQFLRCSTGAGTGAEKAARLQGDHMLPCLLGVPSHVT
jgi:hypothetical protein